MRQTLLAFAFVLAGTGGVFADPANDGIRATISGQIDAFASGDMAGAFDFASDGIRRIFGTSANFGTMVERGYSMVIAPSEIRFGELRDELGGQMQRVLIRDSAGVWHALDYLMVEENGNWRIGGVELLAQQAVGA